jgi:hypothetical protein
VRTFSISPKQGFCFEWNLQYFELNIGLVNHKVAYLILK